MYLYLVFSFYIIAVLIRFLLQWVGGDFYNPISQFLVKITHPILRVLRRYIPAIGKVDTSSIVLLVVLQMISDSIVLTLKGLSPQGIKLEKTAEAMFLRSTKPIDNITAITENESQMLDAFLSQRGSYEHAKQLLARLKGWNLDFPKKASKEFKQQVSNWLYPHQK